MKLHQTAMVAAATIALSFAGAARADVIDFDEFGPPEVTCCYADTGVTGPIVYSTVTIQDGNGSGHVMNGDDGWASLQTSGDNLFGTLGSGSIHFLFTADVFGVNFDIINGFFEQAEYTVNLFDAADMLLETGSITLGNYASPAGVGHVSFAATGVRRVELIGNGNFAVDTIGFNGDGGVVPEPATWALMIGGFGLAGSALRRRRMATNA